MLQLRKLKEKWELEGVNNFVPADLHVLVKFQSDNGINLSDDLKEYFGLLNGTGGECTNELYEFYAVDRIKRLVDEFKNWRGVPEYQALLNVEEVKDLFVFANYCFNTFAYAIRLSHKNLEGNEVYILCGKEYKKISNTFTGFLDLYLIDSIELQFNKEKGG